MQFVRGNRAVRDHAAEGRELHLFEDVKGGYLRYVGEMTCAGYDVVDDVDVNGDPRRAIVFRLISVGDLDEAQGSDGGGEDERLWTRPLKELRQMALDAPAATKQSRDAHRGAWSRSRALRVYILRRADGACEACNRPAPFSTPDGHPFLEAHHTRRLSDGGPDDPRWVIAVCPNCHRRAHYATDASAFNDSLKARLGALEEA